MPYQQKYMSNGTKKHNFVEADVVNISVKFQHHPHYDFWDDFLIFLCKFSLSVAMATNQIQPFGQKWWVS